MEKRSIEFTKDESLAVLAGLEVALKQAGAKYVDTFKYFQNKFENAFKEQAVVKDKSEEKGADLLGEK